MDFGSKVKSTATDVKKAAKDVAHDARNTMKDVGHDVRNAASDVMHDARNAAQDMKASVDRKGDKYYDYHEGHSDVEGLESHTGYDSNIGSMDYLRGENRRFR